MENLRDSSSEQRTVRVQNGISSTVSNGVQNNKRRAEDVLAGPVGKVVKNGMASVQTPRTTPSIIQRQPKSLQSPETATAALPSTLTVPYRGTSKLNPTSAAQSPISPATSSGDCTKAPKKGSYAEIMARAKASQAKPAVVGAISHKPKEEISISYKKDLKLKKRALRAKQLGVKDDSRPGSPGRLSSSPAPGVGNSKKIVETASKGTAKPLKPQPTYKGTMKPSSVVAKQLPGAHRANYASKPRYDEYAATDEDDLDDIEEGSYGSDDSDDMEAGFTDVEQEETAAAKAARKEDEEEARLEAKLKREKEDRKRKLEQMAKVCALVELSPSLALPVTPQPAGSRGFAVNLPFCQPDYPRKQIFSVFK